MRIILAPDSYKGSLSASKAAEIMARAGRKVFPGGDFIQLPLSDGGEGLVDSLVKATGGEILYKEVVGPIGETVQAFWGVLGNKSTAVIEMAAASGLLLVPKEKRNPLVTTTYGLGELIKTALDAGCTKLIIGIGGSATNDGGGGMAQALGVKLLDGGGNNLPWGGKALSSLENIDVSGLDPRLKNTEIVVACDVDNPLTGPQGAAYVYAPQKGATKEMVGQLDEALKHFSNIIFRELSIKVDNVQGAGAAGGLGAGLMAFLNGRLTSGMQLVMDIVEMERHLTNCDLVLTGEGKLDGQSVFGKVPVGVARKAKEYGIPVVAIAGSVAQEVKNLHREGITAYFSIINAPMTLQEAIDNAEDLLEEATLQVLRFFGA